MEKRYLVGIIFAVLLFSVIPNSSANSIDDIILKHKQKEWYVGSNLNSGDSFTYRICDDKTFTKSNFSEKCYSIQLDFYGLFDVANGKTWVVQSLIFTDEFTKPGIFQINAVTFEITTDYSNLEFSQSIENTLFNIKEFASTNNPKTLQIGKTWGTVPSYLTLDSDVIVLNESITKIGQEEFKVFEVGYNVKKQSSYSISKHFPFPLWGHVYSSTVIYPEPDFLFSFELLKYNFADIENNMLAIPSYTEVLNTPDDVITINDAFVPNYNDDLICISNEFVKLNSTGSIIIDDAGWEEIKYRKYLDDAESDIGHETFVRSIEDIFQD